MLNENSTTTTTARVLLDLNLSALHFELLFDRFGFSFGHRFFRRLGRAVDEIFGLFQTQAGKLAHDFDDLNLLLTGFGKNDVKLGLFLGHRRRPRRRRPPPSARMTLTSVFPPAPAAAPAAAATATGAAALTPNSSSSSLTSDAASI